MSNYLDQLNWRAAIKNFDPEKRLSEEQLHHLQEAARMAPTSFGLQPLRIIPTEDSTTREALKASAWGQNQITDCSELFIFCIRTDLDENMVQEYIELLKSARGSSDEEIKQHKAMMVGAVAQMDDNTKKEWAAKQAYIALGFVLDAAAQNSIDACPMEGFNSVEFDKILDLEKHNLQSVVVCALGFRSPEDKYSKMPKVRVPKETFFINK
jgi:nitroreductase